MVVAHRRAAEVLHIRLVGLRGQRVLKKSSSQARFRQFLRPSCWSPPCGNRKKRGDVKPRRPATSRPVCRSQTTHALKHHRLVGDAKWIMSSFFWYVGDDAIFMGYFLMFPFPNMKCLVGHVLSIYPELWQWDSLRDQELFPDSPGQGPRERRSYTTLFPPVLQRLVTLSSSGKS